MLYPCSRLVKDVVEEKESMIKDTLQMMGMQGLFVCFGKNKTEILTFFLNLQDGSQPVLGQ